MRVELKTNPIKSEIHSFWHTFAYIKISALKEIFNLSFQLLIKYVKSFNTFSKTTDDKPGALHFVLEVLMQELGF